MCYDSTGNILVENKVSAAKDGYPVEIALSNDGTTLIVSYLHVQSGALASNVVYYNFGDAGREEKIIRLPEKAIRVRLFQVLFYG